MVTATSLLSLRPYQDEALAAVEAAERSGQRRVIIAHATGLGKAQPDDEAVLTPTGFRPMGALEIGDLVIAGDGTPTKVLGVYPQGRRAIVKVHFSDGAAARCDLDHLWNVQTDDGWYRTKEWRTLPTRDLFPLDQPSGRRKWRVPMVGPVEGQPVDVPVDPYVIGVLIADGAAHHPLVFCPGDQDSHVVEKVGDLLPPELRLHRVDGGARRHAGWRIARSNGSGRGNILLDYLRETGLEGLNSWERFIPPALLHGSIAQRRSLFDGLWDSDGSSGVDREYSTSSEALAVGIRHLIRGLGGIARMNTRMPTYTYKGEKLTGRKAWRVYPSFDRGAVRKITEITPDGTADATCIAVAHPSQTYVTRDHVVTHNTVLFATLIAKRPGRALVLAHRDELIGQAVGKLRMVAGDSLSIGVVKAERNEVHARVIVASVQTLARPARMAEVVNADGGLFGPLDAFSTVVVDECFPAGTMVGGTPIERVRVGDLVPSWDDRTGEWGYGQVIATMQRQPAALVTLHFASGRRLTCTPEHPIATAEGWVPAVLTHGASVLLSHHERAMGRVFQVRDEVPDREEVAAEPSAKRSAPLLLPRVLRSLPVAPVLGADGGHESQARLGSDESSESDASARQSREDASDLARHWASTYQAWWERPWPLRAATLIGASAPVAHGGGHSYGTTSAPRDADALQARHCQPDVEDRRRSGRIEPRDTGPTGAGPQEGCLLRVDRVDRVEVHEPTSDGRFAGLCPDGFVYNLEVAGVHTYTANGVVVHNCHHAGAVSYGAVLAGTTGPDTLVVGVTATPERGDKRSLLKVFPGGIVHSMSTLDGIEGGWLTDVRALNVGTDLDLSKVRQSHGDFTDASLGEEMERAGVPERVAAAWVELAPERKGVVYCPTIATSKACTAALVRAGVAAEHVDGTTPDDARRAILGRHRAGVTRVVSNAMVLTEGYDDPSIDAIVMARPTRSRVLYTQILGRALRPSPGKTEALLLDITGRADKVDLASVWNVLGLKDPARVEAAKAAAEASGLLPPSVLDVVKGEREAVERRTEAVTLFERSRIRWVSAGAAWVLSLPGDRMLRLVPDEASWTWAVDEVAGRRLVERHREGLTLEYAQGIAEAIVRQRDEGWLRVADRQAAWRSRPASEKQIAYLRRLRVEVPDGCTAGDASDLISAAKAGVG